MQALLIIFLFLLSACATVGPQISAEEERRAQALLLAEAKEWQKKQEQRILDIAAPLIKAAANPTSIKFHYAGRPEDTGGRFSPDLVNAWTDGESVWVTRGMIRFLKNDDELAVVLAHEMAHAYLGHMNYLRAKQLLGLALIIPAGIFGGQAGSNLAQLLIQASTKKFDRDQEREADLYGLIWAHKAGFNMDAAKNVFRRMAVENPESVTQGFLSSHPTSAERFLAMEKVADALKQGLDPLKVFAPKGKDEGKAKPEY